MASRDSDFAREMKRLFRSMTFVSRHPSLERDDAEAKRFAEIYQQLGMLWEFLALQCSHAEGWRKLRGGKLACKRCGTIRGATEKWILMPRNGRKTVGRKQFPTSRATFPNKKAATIVDDSINFHGALVNVDVHNSYRSRLFPRRRLDIAVAPERIVRVQEGGIECALDTHMVTLKLRKHKRGERPPYGALLCELPKRFLNRFPILVDYDTRGNLVGVTIFRPSTPQQVEKPRRAKMPTDSA